MTSKLKNVSLNGMVGQIFTQNHPFLASPCSESGKKKGTATQAAGGFFWAPRYLTEVKDIHSILESLCQPSTKQFCQLNRELPDRVFFQSGTKRKTVAIVKKKKNDTSHQLVAALDQGTDLEYNCQNVQDQHHCQKG
jgi:hypothetical protein